MNHADDLYSFENIYRQYIACRANKRNTLNALVFEADAEANVLALQAELRAHTYRPGTSICFVSTGAKPREVFAADFRDRVVHHLLVSRQEPLLEPRFIHDSFACRRGKGTLAASDRLATFMRRVTANSARPAWALRLDVASFFPSINKRYLYEILADGMADPQLLWLTRVILFNDPTQNYRFRSLSGRTPPPGSPGYPVPERKSLFGKGNQRGLPIGNLTSQFWANVYLDRLDQFVKHTLRCPYYVRYVDDTVLLSTDREQLVEWRGAIESFLRERLALELRPGTKELLPLAGGVEFVGWKTWANHRVPRRQTVGNLVRAVDRFERCWTEPAFGGDAVCINPGRRRPVRRARGRALVTAPSSPVEHLRDVLASYSGHLRHGDAGARWETVWCTHGWLGALLVRDGWKLTMRWPAPREVVAQSAGPKPRYGDRYRAAIAGAGEDCLVFWRVGRFVEFHGPQRVLAERVLGLRRVHLGRGDYAFTAGFPHYLTPVFVARAVAAGTSVLLVPRRRGGDGQSPGATRGPTIVAAAAAGAGWSVRSRAVRFDHRSEPESLSVQNAHPLACPPAVRVQTPQGVP